MRRRRVDPLFLSNNMHIKCSMLRLRTEGADALWFCPLREDSRQISVRLSAKAAKEGGMSFIEIAGVKTRYSSIRGLGEAVEEELANTKGRLVKAVQAVRKLRRARRALRKMLGEQKAKLAQAIAGAGCGREAVGVLH
jgi:hypothetical protein